MKLTLGKEKKLKSRKAIEKIFAEGKSFHKFPVRVVYFHEPGIEPVFKIGVSVPKKRFKRAVDRNLLKRRLREAFRKNQLNLKSNHNLSIMFIYSSNEILPYREIEKSMIVLIAFLNSISDDCIENK